MGLDTSHDCWHGAYSAFMRWRQKIAELAGIPLPLMEGFYDPSDATNPLKCSSYEFGVETWNRFLPIQWETLRDDPLHYLLSHSDCDGKLDTRVCKAIADRLEQVLPHLPEGTGGGHVGDWRETTRQFIKGLNEAWNKGEDVEFH